MPNDYFQFQQFRVQQGNSAMKVCTDACIFGAWMANHLQDCTGNLLDIGTGTGLLSLLVAQKNQLQITAIELDDAAALEAAGNFQQSPWHKRLEVVQADIRDYAAEVPFDYIISNPPFYDNDLPSGNEQRDIALHSKELKLEALITSIQRLLQPAGKWAVLLPENRRTFAIELANQAGWFLEKQLIVSQRAAVSPFRCCLLFSKKDDLVVETEILYIRESEEYSAGMRALLSDYYLAFAD
jgi:tRNA1Val (adenine37-N6)-methyltransferase